MLDCHCIFIVWTLDKIKKLSKKSTKFPMILLIEVMTIATTYDILDNALETLGAPTSMPPI